MHRLTKAVEKKIAAILPPKFPLTFDGWTLTGSSTHYIAIFATTFNDLGIYLNGFLFLY
jgi:hypothetical protein